MAVDEYGNQLPNYVFSLSEMVKELKNRKRDEEAERSHRLDRIRRSLATAVGESEWDL